MPNGRPKELEELKAIRAVSAFWALIWQIGDVAVYVAIVGVFMTPIIFSSAFLQGSISFAQYLLKTVIVVGIASAVGWVERSDTHHPK